MLIFFVVVREGKNGKRKRERWNKDTQREMLDGLKEKKEFNL